MTSTNRHASPAGHHVQTGDQAHIATLVGPISNSLGIDATQAQRGSCSKSSEPFDLFRAHDYQKDLSIIRGYLLGSDVFFCFQGCQPTEKGQLQKILQIACPQLPVKILS